MGGASGKPGHVRGAARTSQDFEGIERQNGGIPSHGLKLFSRQAPAKTGLQFVIVPTTSAGTVTSVPSTGRGTASSTRLGLSFWGYSAYQSECADHCEQERHWVSVHC
jgi:hypothetical protein